MDPNLFSIEQRRHLVKTLDGAWAFVPPPLPPQLDLAALALPLATAAAAVGELKGAARRLQNPYMLIRPLQRREALTSSAMEGTITTLNDLLLQEAEPLPPVGDDARETFNYVRALVSATEKLKSLPISHRVIKGAQAELLRGLSPARGAGKRPGEYKVHQNAVGKRGDSLKDARYVPPPPAQTPECMDRLEAFINRETQVPAARLVDLAISHYQFEAIHPFDDGNGRIGRMLVTLMAMQSGLLDMPLLHISARLEGRREDYIDRLFAVSTQGDWTGWIAFFLDIVAESSLEAVAIVDRILALQTSLRARAKSAGKSARLPTIVDALFDTPWTTSSEVCKLCSVTFPTAQSDLKALVRAGLVQERQGSAGRLYVAPEILALSDR